MGSPQTNKQYLFFVQQNQGDWVILTGYEFANDRVIPLDGRDSQQNDRSGLPFIKYRNSTSNELIGDLKSELANKRGGVSK